MPPNTDIDLPAILAHPATAGIAGSLVGLRVAPGSTWGERIANVACGALIAAYVGPAVAEWLGIAGPTGQALLGFGLGLAGLTLADVSLRAVRELRLADVLASWITRR